MSDEKKLNVKQAASWAMYDLANTIYSAAVVTVFLPLYITSLTRYNIILGITATLSMILAGLFAPILGAITDKTGRTKRYLIVSTLITCAAVFGFVFSVPLGALLFFFVAAHFFYHLSLVYYNALLPAVAPPEKQGWISGLGVGLGYAGVIVALPVGYFVEKYFGTRFVFPAVSLAFLTAALPLFFFVPERKVDHAERFRPSMIVDEFKEVARTLLRLPAHKKVMFFLIGNFFVQEAVNACILWLSVFLKFTFKLEQGALILVLMGTNVFACLFGLLTGYLTDRFGALKTTWASAFSLFLALSFLFFTHNAYFAMAAVMIFGSLGLAGTWVAGRKLLIELSPPEKIGEFFGLYGMTTKLACFSMAFFALIADRASFRAAIGELILVLLIGLFFLGLVGRKK